MFFANCVMLTSFEHGRNQKEESISILGTVQIACSITKSICGLLSVSRMKDQQESVRVRHHKRNTLSN